MLLQIIGLKCDRLANEGGDTVELRQTRETVTESARSEHYAVLWGPQEFGTEDQWELDHSVQGQSIDRSISFDGQIELSLVAAGPSSGTPTEIGTVTITSDACEPSMSERRLLARFNAHGHYTLSYRVDTEEGVSGEGGDAYELACTPLPAGVGVPDEIATAREGYVRIDRCIAPEDEEECLRLPRRVVYDSDNSRMAEYVFGSRGARGRMEALAQDRVRWWFEHCRQCGEGGEPDVQDTSTWGSHDRLEVPCCRLEYPGGDFNRIPTLVFDSSVRWTWDVYNLNLMESEFAPWKEYLIRTLMVFPIEHLKAAGGPAIDTDATTELAEDANGELANAIPGLQTLVFDLKVYTFDIGRYRASGVGKGGANWVLQRREQRWREEYSRQNDGATAPSTPAVLPVVLVAYAALNQPWLRDWPANEADIDEWYSADNFAEHNTRINGTIFHEFGHLFNPIGKGAHNTEWRNFMTYIDYHGVTTDVGEGFCEAYRYWMTGQSTPAYISQAFADLTFNHPDHAGVVAKVIPTAGSVNEARAAIADHRQSVAAGEDQDCRIEQP